jgi:hypothetical protein
VTHTIWRRLEIGDDWGAKYYAYAGERYNERGMADQRRGIKFRVGEELDIRWPNGDVATVRLAQRTERGTVRDMGNSYSVTERYWGFWHDVHGTQVFVDLADVEIPGGRTP